MKIAKLSGINMTVHNVFSVKIQPLPYAYRKLIDNCKFKYADEDDIILTLKLMT